VCVAAIHVFLVLCCATKHWMLISIYNIMYLHCRLRVSDSIAYSLVLCRRNESWSIATGQFSEDSLLGDASRLKAQTHMYYSSALSCGTRGGGNNEHFPRVPPFKSKAFSEDYNNFICPGAPEKTSHCCQNK